MGHRGPFWNKHVGKIGDRLPARSAIRMKNLRHKTIFPCGHVRLGEIILDQCSRTLASVEPQRLALMLDDVLRQRFEARRQELAQTLQRGVPVVAAVVEQSQIAFRMGDAE